MKKAVLLATGMIASLVLSTCGGVGGTPAPGVTGVSLDKASLALLVGTTARLTATIAPAGATYPAIAWGSTNPGVATVDSSGLVTAVSMGAAAITAASADSGKSALCRVIAFGSTIPSAASRLEATQDNDGGWEWPEGQTGWPDTDPTTGKPTPSNTLGETVEGVGKAYALTGNYFAVCGSTYDRLTLNATSGDRKIRGPDITFLVELSETTGDSTFANFARTRYKATLNEFGNKTAAGMARYIRDGRIGSWPTLISWDIDSLVLAALALDRYFPGQGFGADAASMTEVIYNALYGDPVCCNLTNTTQNEYWLAVTGALDAFAATGLHPSEMTVLKASLLASRQLDGHFVGVGTGSNYQTTAYAIMALVRAGGADNAVSSAIAYLVASQNKAGGWTESDGNEYPTIGGEILNAIIYSLEASSRRLH